MTDLESASAYVILMRFTTHAGLAEAFSRRLQDFSAYMHAQPGCLQFELAGNPDQSNDFILYEVFSDEAAWSTHHRKLPLTALLAEIGPMLAIEPDRTVWKRLVV